MQLKTNIQDFCTEDEVVKTNDVVVVEEAEAAEQEASQDTEAENEENAVSCEAVEADTEEAAESVPAEDEKNEAARDCNESCTEEKESTSLDVSVLLAQNSELKQQIENLNNSLDKLTVQVSSMNRSISAHEAIEANMNKELQRYKNDLYTSIATPFLMHLVSLHCEIEKEVSDMKKEVEDAEAKGEKVYLDEAISSLQYYYEKIAGSLVNSGVEVKTPESGDKFDPMEQRIAKVAHTEDNDKNGVVESVRSSTYIYNGKILMPAKVVVYKTN
jgi:molecular chaperone GrpE (heat shock protein)